MLGILLLALATTFATLAGIRRLADGPLGPLPGGPLTSGPLEDDPDVDWGFAEAVVLAELQLEATGASRTTGILVHQGQLYVPCDLGFVWRRVPAPARWPMALVSWIKRWHRDVARDDRVVIRIRGRRFERRAIPVAEPKTLAALRAATEARAERFLGRPLLDAEADPSEIAFFRLDPRHEATRA